MQKKEKKNLAVIRIGWFGSSRFARENSVGKHWQLQSRHNTVYEIETSWTPKTRLKQHKNSYKNKILNSKIIDHNLKEWPFPKFFVIRSNWNSYKSWTFLEATRIIEHQSYWLNSNKARSIRTEYPILI